MMADLIIINAKIHPNGKKNHHVSAIAIKNGLVLKLGSNEEMRDLITPSTRVIEGEGRTILPGFIESHAHFLSTGAMKNIVNLINLKSLSLAINKVEEKVKEVKSFKNFKDIWIRGRGWDQTLWDKKEFPSKEDLDQVSKEIPIMLTRVDGHAFWLNSKALEIAQIDENTISPEGGKILKDSKNKVTGILIDNAVELVKPYLPPKSYQERYREFQFAMDEALSLGITTFHDAGIFVDQMKLPFDYLSQGKLKIRLNIMIDASDKEALKISLNEGIKEKDSRVKVSTLKLFLDGALGSHGALLSEPYSDEENNYGIQMLREEVFREISIEGIKKGFQIAVHAIGDKAVSLLIDQIELIKKEIYVPPYTFRLEHGELIQKRDILRLKKNEVIVSHQPIHLLDDKEMLLKHIGKERAFELTMPWRDLIKLEIPICFGSDSPVAKLSPFWGIWSAIARRQIEKDDFVLNKDQLMTIDEAIESYTGWGAFSSRESHLKGDLSVGKFADMIVLDQDIFNIPIEDIPNIKVEKTFVGGELVFDRK